jgi:predicted nicotinamide N-methyase
MKRVCLLSVSNKVDVIVGSELAYDEQNTKLLLKTIDYFRQQNPQLLVLIGYTRYPQPHKNLKTYLVGRQH